ASTRGSICSTKGIITRITNGTVGTRLASTTPAIEPASLAWYSTDASGMPKVIGGTMSGSRNSSIRARLPAKSRRAIAYAAGTPSRPDKSTTRPTISKVTSSTSPSWNSPQAALYQRVVQPAGSQVPSQRVPSELTATEAISANRFSTKKITTTHTAVTHRRPSALRAVISTLSAARRTAVQQPAQHQHRGDDAELHEAHDHRDRRGEAVV